MKNDAALDVSTSKSAVGMLNCQDSAVVLETAVKTDASAIFAALSPMFVLGHGGKETPCGLALGAGLLGERRPH